jgi:hypothetical protein
MCEELMEYQVLKSTIIILWVDTFLYGFTIFFCQAKELIVEANPIVAMVELSFLNLASQLMGSKWASYLLH